MIQIVEDESNDITHTIASFDVGGAQANPNEGGERKNMGSVSAQSKGGPRKIHKQQEIGVESVSPGELPEGNNAGVDTLNNQNNEDNTNDNNQQIDNSTNELNGAVSKYDHQGSDQH